MESRRGREALTHERIDSISAIGTQVRGQELLCVYFRCWDGMKVRQPTSQPSGNNLEVRGVP
jgi:hypothetical protein